VLIDSVCELLQGVRQMAVDLLGSIAAALCADKDAAEADAAWLRDVVSQAGLCDGADVQAA